MSISSISAAGSMTTPLPMTAWTPVAENAARNQLENELFLADKNRVPGVMAALIARNDIKVLGEKVDNFAFSLIAPLGAKHNQITHSFSLTPLVVAPLSMLTHGDSV